jgi:hypothetical protein
MPKDAQEIDHLTWGTRGHVPAMTLLASEGRRREETHTFNKSTILPDGSIIFSIIY